MKNNNERVLAFNLATEVNEETLEKVAGGSARVTYRVTDYYTNKHGVSDVDLDMEWD